MKIGILNFHRALNYGAVLQCYGLQETLTALGHEVSVIDYRPRIIEKHRSYFLFDILKEKAAAQALDLDDCVSGALCGHDAVIRAGEYEELNDADIMVVAFGRSRKPGETRLDMFDDTIRMANEVIGHLKQVDFKGIMISISNPADIICEYIRRQMNWQTNR